MPTYKTRTQTELYTRIGGLSGIKPPAGTILETGSNPIWVKDGTIECRVIIPRTDGVAYPGEYIDKRVAFSVLAPYMPPPPTVPPTPDEAEFRWKNAAGEVIVTEIWIRKG